jgi:hypothetical protein
LDSLCGLSSFETINIGRSVADTLIEGPPGGPRETAMTDSPTTKSEFGGEMRLLAGVWVLVCIAVLTTAALA